MKFITAKTKYLIAVAVCLISVASAGQSQTPPRELPAKPKANKDMPEMPAKEEKIWPPVHGMTGGGGTYEKSITVDPKVNLTLCVTEGNVEVNGWSRNEVRVFVKDGSKFGFKVLQKNVKNQSPVWIMLTGQEPIKGKNAPASECIWGSEIEIDVPDSSTVNMKGRETKTTIDSVRKVSVNNGGGDISIRNVAEGIIASTYEGDVSVENSQGAMVLESSTGNIIAFETGPSEIGDIFKAKTTSGTISLQKLGYRQTEVKSISGSVVFNGEILGGGSYSFGTTNGSIKLTLPLKTSCRIAATYGFGNFDSELPIKIQTENVGEGPVKSIVGTLGTGSGDATLKLTTNDGSITIRKQQ